MDKEIIKKLIELKKLLIKKKQIDSTLFSSLNEIINKHENGKKHRNITTKNPQ